MAEDVPELRTAHAKAALGKPFRVEQEAKRLPALDRRTQVLLPSLLEVLNAWLFHSCSPPSALGVTAVFCSSDALAPSAVRCFPSRSAVHVSCGS